MQLQVGQVYRLWCMFCQPQKSKYFVVARVTPRPRFFLINSTPTSFQASNANQMASMLNLSPTDHAFLSHDCFLDCTVLVGGYTAQEVEDLHFAEPSIFLGVVSSEIRQSVRGIAATSNLLTGSEKTSLLADW